LLVFHDVRAETVDEEGTVNKVVGTMNADTDGTANKKCNTRQRRNNNPLIFSFVVDYIYRYIYYNRR
jgi:hypothetical protein